MILSRLTSWLNKWVTTRLIIIRVTTREEIDNEERNLPLEKSLILELLRPSSARAEQGKAAAKVSTGAII
jgi:hypothetical protein